MILLTGSEYQMTTPDVVLTSGQHARFYFGRVKSEEPPPRFINWVASFPEIEPTFGDLFFAWLKAREELGSGAYLYLATRRGLDIYEEHKFLNLMTGLESYHRARFGNGDTTAFDKKIGRIVAQVTAPKDRSWLKKRLKNLGSPSLEERLLVLLLSVPIPLEESALREFLGACAKVRNQIAHTGHSEDASASGQPLHWMSVRSAILSHLYHAKLLLEIGLPKPLVERWLTTSPASFHLRWYLREAGLEVDSPSAHTT